MSRYITLDPHRQFEQTIADDLKSALDKRGFSVLHNGKWDSHAPGGKPDIIAWDENYVLIFEVTKSKSAAQDREFQSIRSHLKEVKAKNPDKLCFCIFISPKTSERTFDSIHDHNHQRASEGKTDMKILPLAIETFEFWINRLIGSSESNYPVIKFIEIFDPYDQFTGDARIFDLLVDRVFPNEKNGLEAKPRNDVLERSPKLDRLVNQMSREKIGLSWLDIEAISSIDFLVDQNIRSWERLARSEGLSLTQVYALQEIYYRKSCVMSVLREILEITPASVSQLTDDLVRLGWVIRAEYPGNRRMKQLTLSPKGMAFIEEGSLRQRAWMDELLMELDEEKQGKVFEMFEILSKAIPNL